MNRDEFISCMEEIEEKFYERQRYIRRIEELFGREAADYIYEWDFIYPLLDQIEKQVVGTSDGKWLQYIFIDCECDFDIACIEFEGMPVYGESWGEIYDFLLEIRRTKNV